MSGIGGNAGENPACFGMLFEILHTLLGGHALELFREAIALAGGRRASGVTGMAAAANGGRDQNSEKRGYGSRPQGFVTL